MKGINNLYITALVLGLCLFVITQSMQSKSASFYGFAENKETEINHIEDVRIEEIFVENGQEVKKGDLLIIVKDNLLPSKIDGLKLEKEEITESSKLKRNEILKRIESIKLSRDIELSDLDFKVKTLERELELKQSLYKGLKSIDQKEQNISAIDLEKLASLKETRMIIVSSADKEILFQRQLLSTFEKPSLVKSEKLDTEIKQYEEETARLSIYAPSDGLIGTIGCKEGENIPAFTTLMNFYKHNPTLVKGYVHEKMILEVKLGDKLEVSSSLHPDHHIQGEVIGLGSRIVEIPERLRKIPDFKSYGREVLIRIPAENNFLQKEKVLLNTAQRFKDISLGTLFSAKKASQVGACN